jgi:hypothetical protein
MNVSNLTRIELAGLIGQTLTDHGIDAVLSGGSCVSIYSNERWVSQDLDLIDISYSDKKKIIAALHTIGFTNRGAGHKYFVNPHCEFTIEFPTAPLMIGDEHVVDEGIVHMATDSGVFKLLSATNCVKDRLASYIHWNDLQCLAQARDVAHLQTVDMNNIQSWLSSEGSAIDARVLLAKPSPQSTDD